MADLSIFLIKVYQRTISPDHGVVRRRISTCKFYPTCSEYAVLAMQKQGFFIGMVLTIKRIGRCNPWATGGYDPL